MVTLVRIGEEEAAVYIVSDTELQFTTPAAATTGLVDVTVVTDAGEATLADAFEYLDEPNIELTIPAEIDAPVGVETTYATRMTNFGAEAVGVTEEIRISNAAGDLAAADVRYGSMDVGGVWNEVTWTEDGGDLVATYTYTHIHANGDADSDVKILVVRDDTGDLSGTSTYTLDADGSVLASAAYTFNVTGGA